MPLISQEELERLLPPEAKRAAEYERRFGSMIPAWAVRSMPMEQLDARVSEALEKGRPDPEFEVNPDPEPGPMLDSLDP